MKRKLLLLLAAMLIFGSIKAQEPEHHYQFNYHEFGKMMTMIIQINIDGVEQQTSNVIELGSFNGTTVTGSQMLAEYNGGYYRVYMAVYFNSTYTPLFKIYNHTTGEELGNFEMSLNGEPYGPLELIDGKGPGSKKSPLVMNFTHTQSIEIAPYTANGGWYLIASPLAASTSVSTVTNMTSNDYDLYYFDQTQEKEWVNYKSGGEVSINPGFSLVPGKGYLYANSAQTTLTFVGAPYSGNLEVTLVNDASSPHLQGWNLIGNSFSTPKSLTGISYYRMNPEGRGELIAGEGNIAGMEGVFVFTETNGQVIGFGERTTKRADEENRVALNLLGNDEKTIDRIIVGFDERTVLPKYYMNENSTVIYVSQPDRDYAVVKGSETSVFQVSFKTSDLGTYTLKSDLGGASVNYMHLIDKITGKDIDMLLEGEYTFIGAPTDREDRFILRLTYSGNFNDNGDNFAYQNGTDLIICGDGTLQVFDVMGRFVSSQEIHGVETIQALPAGVYVLRMIGDDIQTQKIVVR